MRTAITSLLGVRHPIVGFNRSPRVVAEVTKAGGFGVLAASAYTPPPGLVARAKEQGVLVAALVGQAKHARRIAELGALL
jgi:NAD(P)H-dependent flavin oxidoreductase YrpB (nitropropane dioxygenase family)